MANTTHHGHNDATTLMPETIAPSKVNLQITMYVTTPVATIGVVLNLLQLWIWSLQQEFIAAFFLFKVLAVFDILYALNFLLWFWQWEGKLRIAWEPVYFMWQVALVNTTLLLAITRWTAVFFPMRYKAIVTPFRLRLGVGSIVMVSLLTLCLHLFDLKPELLGEKGHDIMDTMLLETLLTAPMVIQAVLCASLVRRTWDHYHQLESIVTNPSHRRRSRGKARRTTLTVVCISLTSFLIYPGCTQILIYFNLTPDRTTQAKESEVVAVINLLQIINSSINFFFYLAFMPEFRRIAQQRVDNISTRSTSTSRSDTSKRTSRSRSVHDSSRASEDLHQSHPTGDDLHKSHPVLDYRRHSYPFRHSYPLCEDPDRSQPLIEDWGHFIHRRRILSLDASPSLVKSVHLYANQRRVSFQVDNRSEAGSTVPETSTRVVPF
ncbi:hypothetical protein V1264_012790 [Littorina saxatilis]|uniref:G-protein coupled receptors family 1 profile domain-containing protein n=1 Tax=Littorina saxatilis TaxID=31220 RepID=A0AAN9BXS3_9CAEN